MKRIFLLLVGVLCLTGTAGAQSLGEIDSTGYLQFVAHCIGVSGADTTGDSCNYRIWIGDDATPATPWVTTASANMAPAWLATITDGGAAAEPQYVFRLAAPTALRDDGDTVATCQYIIAVNIFKGTHKTTTQFVYRGAHTGPRPVNLRQWAGTDVDSTRKNAAGKGYPVVVIDSAIPAGTYGAMNGIEGLASNVKKVGDDAITDNGDGRLEVNLEEWRDAAPLGLGGTGSQNVLVTVNETVTNANVTQISGDGTAADNAESFFDGTGYAGTGNTIPTVTNVSGNLAGSIGSLGATAKTDVITAVWTTAGSRTLTAGTNISLAKGTGITGFNDIAASDVWTATGGDSVLQALDYTNNTRHILRTYDTTGWAASCWAHGTRRLTELDEDNTTIDLNGSTVGTVTTVTTVATVAGLADSMRDVVGDTIDASFGAIFSDVRFWLGTEVPSMLNYGVRAYVIACSTNVIGADAMASNAIGSSELAGTAAGEIRDSNWMADSNYFTPGDNTDQMAYLASQTGAAGSSNWSNAQRDSLLNLVTNDGSHPNPLGRVFDVAGCTGTGPIPCSLYVTAAGSGLQGMFVRLYNAAGAVIATGTASDVNGLVLFNMAASTTFYGRVWHAGYTQDTIPQVFATGSSGSLRDTITVTAVSPTLPDSAGLCRLWGYVATPFGAVIPKAIIEIGPDQADAALAGNKILVPTSTRAVTNASGRFDLYVEKSSNVTMPQADSTYRYKITIYVPDATVGDYKAVSLKSGATFTVPDSTSYYIGTYLTE